MSEHLGRDPLVIWRRRLWLWLPALVFFALNLSALLVYRVAVAGEFVSLERRVESKREDLARLEAESGRLGRLVNTVETNQAKIEELYEERFSTRRRRLTQVTEEVKSLARQAGLQPRTLSYPEEPVEALALVERGFVFTVQGSYQQLRTFINFLELSPSFISLRRVELSESRGTGTLVINLTLSTLFAEQDEVPEEISS